MVAAFDEFLERNEENAGQAAAFSLIHAGLVDSFSSPVSMNLNARVQTLTEITIALAISAIIAALRGLNVPTAARTPRDRVPRALRGRVPADPFRRGYRPAPRRRS